MSFRWNLVANVSWSRLIRVTLRRSTGRSTLYIHTGAENLQSWTIPWAKEVEERGAGEILLTSMDTDGTKAGFALELTATVSGNANIPVIASGGAGSMEHFYDVFTTGKADAGLAASIFHFREIDIPDLKKYLHDQNLPIRMTR
jgi:cyclase